VGAHNIETLHSNRRGASHLQPQRRRTYSPQSKHIPALHKALRECIPQRLLDWVERIGTYILRIVEYLLTHKHHPEIGYRSCLCSISLALQHGSERL